MTITYAASPSTKPAAWPGLPLDGEHAVEARHRQGAGHVPARGPEADAVAAFACTAAGGHEHPEARRVDELEVAQVDHHVRTGVDEADEALRDRPRVADVHLARELDDRRAVDG